MAFVAGGPDENPRFPKTRSPAINRVRKYNPGVCFAMTHMHAPGMSALNVIVDSLNCELAS